MRRFLILSALIVFHVRADNEDARKLMHEAMAVLKQSDEKTVPPEEYAECILKLEKAQALLEKDNAAENDQSQEVAAALFWARRFSNTKIIDILEKRRSAENIKPVKKLAPPPAAAEKNVLPEVRAQRLAKEAFDLAEKFEQKSKGDDYAVALRYFMVANNHAGTEFALKALGKARAAQERLIKSGGKVDSLMDAEGSAELAMLKDETPQMELARSGDKHMESKEYDEAIVDYKGSLKAKESIVVLRHLGMAYFKKAELVTEQVTPKFVAFEKEYSDAYASAWKNLGGNKYFDDRTPAFVAAQKKYEALRQESASVLQNYVAAEQSFNRIVKLKKTDFEASAYVGISMARRPDAKFRARGFLHAFIHENKPSNGLQTLTYEYCKTELDRMGRGG